MSESPPNSPFFSEYSDTTDLLPRELQRNYKLIGDLDKKAQALMKQVAEETVKVTKEKHELTKKEKKKILDNIGFLLNDVMKKGEEKFALAKSTYDTVDRHCTRLDDELQRIEDEQMVGSTRGSEIKTGTKSKQSESKKGRRKASVDGYTSDSMQSNVSFSNMPIDPNEPRYCYCNQVSYGEMVACDNEECEIEWFHLDCTELESVPKGSWFCKHCTTNNKKKRRL